VEVIASESASWYLLRKDGQHYLDVNCMASFASFSILLRLDAAEEEEYRALGRAFLQYFAAKVSYWSSRYAARDVTGPLATEAHEAAMNWQRAHQSGSPGT
jgi:hypothetical protein